MSTDLEHAQQIVNPKTGEALTLDSDTADLARYLDDIRELTSVLREADRFVSREIIRRMDAGAVGWTLHVPGFKVSAPSPQRKEEWDGADLYAALMQLVDQRLLTVEAVNAVVEQNIEFKVKKAGINTLRKLGDDHPAVEVIDRLAVFSEPDRNRVKVDRSV